MWALLGDKCAVCGASVTSFAATRAELEFGTVLCRRHFDERNTPEHRQYEREKATANQEQLDKVRERIIETGRFFE